MYYLVEGGEGRAERRMGMNLSLHYSPAHRWSYFPRMTRDEAVLIKCWDSRGAHFFAPEDEGRARAAATVPATFSLHSGFEDPATPEDAPERESIEVRCVAFF